MNNKLAFLFLCLPLLTACASMINSASQRMADNLATAMLNQNDPETIRQATPAYLVLIDSLVQGDPDNPSTLLSASKLYGSYATTFVNDETRAQRLAQQSLDRAQRALCLSLAQLCNARELQVDEIDTRLQNVEARDHATLYGFSIAWAGWVQTHSGDWEAIADIPRLIAFFERCLQLNESYDHGGAHLYLGVLNSQLPAAVGGKPEIGRAHFDKAIAISEGKNLMAKVLYAEHYARLVFDQELHDKLLKQVIAADANIDGLVLINTLAKQRAETLLKESAEFF